MKIKFFLTIFFWVLLPFLFLVLSYLILNNPALSLLLSLLVAAASSAMIYKEKKNLAELSNKDSKNLKNRVSALKTQNKELKDILFSIKDPIVVTDSRGMVTLSNPAFKKLAGRQDVGGQYLSSLINARKFQSFHDDTLRRMEAVSGNIKIHGRYFIISASHIYARRETAFLFQDITQMKDLEKIKRDFVANVSHELKTPLTAIKGFTETLEEELDEENRHFLNIIKRHTERLINIVNDLLVLSELEETDSLEINRFSARELIESTTKIFRREAHEKGIKIKTVIDSKLKTISADEVKLEQLLINLIANAVKYTEKGKVTVEALKENQDVLIRVSDTGIGIENKHLARIFERFYRVSESRSRKSGGTGLGLSIVKHIAMQHGGDVKAESIPGSGSVFTVILPHAAEGENNDS